METYFMLANVELDEQGNERPSREEVRRGLEEALVWAPGGTRTQSATFYATEGEASEAAAGLARAGGKRPFAVVKLSILAEAEHVKTLAPRVTVETEERPGSGKIPPGQARGK